MDREEYHRVKEALFSVLEVNAVKHNFVFTKYASREWRSVSDGKISTHIIFKDKYISRTTRPERAYLTEHFESVVLDGMSPSDKQMWKDSIDMAVYANGVDADNGFRMVGKGDKSGKKTHHFPMNETDPVSWYLLTPTSPIRPEQDVLTLYSEINIVEKEEEEKEVKPEKESKPRGRPKKVNVEPIKLETLGKMFVALDAKKRAYAYKDWTTLMLLCKTLMGDDGLAVFLELSENSGYEDYEEDEATSAFERACPNGSYTEGTLIHWLKEDNPEALSELLREAGQAGRDGYDIVYYETYSSDFMKDLITALNREGLTVVRDSSQIWVRQVLDPVYPHRWTMISRSELSQYLLPRILSMKLAKMTKQGDETVLTPINKDLNFLEKNVWKHLIDFIPIVPEFDSLFESNVGKLCFQNGVLDVPSKQFTTWKFSTHIHTKVVLPFRYEPYSESVHGSQTKEILSFLTDFFGDQPISDESDLTERDRFLWMLARCLAGMRDKVWQLLSSGRNSGRSAIFKILLAVLPGYVQAFNSGAIMTQKISMKADASRELGYWLAPADSGGRLLYCSETQKSQDHSNTEMLNSRLVKLLSGGDPIKARLMRENEATARTVSHQMMIVICDNIDKTRKATAEDAYENASLFSFKRCFLTQEQLDEAKADGSYNKDLMFLADPSKVEKFQKYKLAWIHLIVNSFRPTLYPIIRPNTKGDRKDEDSKEDETDTAVLFRHFNAHFQKDPTAYVSSLDLNQFCRSHETTFSRGEVIPKIEAIGGIYTNKNKASNGKQARGYKGVKYIPCKDCQHADDNCPDE